LPASKNSAFQRPIDCSDTFSRRAASAMLISPATEPRGALSRGRQPSKCAPMPSATTGGPPTADVAGVRPSRQEAERHRRGRTLRGY
jgi:hypothetical protein